MAKINQKHPDIVAAKFNHRLKISISEGRFYFSRLTADALKMKAGMYVTFEDADEDWDFVCNEDPDGFPLAVYGNKEGSLCINSESLTKFFQSSTQIKELPAIINISVTTPPDKQSRPLGKIHITAYKLIQKHKIR